MLMYSVQTETAKAVANNARVSKAIIDPVPFFAEVAGILMIPYAWQNERFLVRVLNPLCSVDVPVSSAVLRLFPLAKRGKLG